MRMQNTINGSIWRVRSVINMGQRKLDNIGVSAFCESMSMMIKSGIQADEAVALLRQGAERADILEQGLARMQEAAESGSCLSEAMEAAEVFPEYAIRMAAAGEAVGRLEGALAQLAKYYAAQKVMGEKLKNAVIYPFILLLASAAALMAMLAMVLPAFTDVYQSLAGSLASSSYEYINWAYSLCRIVTAAMGLLAAMGLAGFLLWKGKGRRFVEGLLIRLPFCAPVMEALGMFRFTSALSTYLASGTTQDQAIEGSIGMVFHAPLAERIRRCAARMEEGCGIARAAYDERLFEPVYGRMLLVGERSGSLEDELQKLTGLLENHCMELIDRMTGFVNPLISGILIFTIGVSLLAGMLPLVGIMNAIG